MESNTVLFADGTHPYYRDDSARVEDGHVTRHELSTMILVHLVRTRSKMMMNVMREFMSDGQDVLGRALLDIEFDGVRPLNPLRGPLP